jgi:hypothetical protein
MDREQLATQERLVGVQCRAVEEEEEALGGD